MNFLYCFSLLVSQIFFIVPMEYTVASIQNPFQLIPDETMLHIIANTFDEPLELQKNYATISLVNKRFNRLAMDKSLFYHAFNTFKNGKGRKLLEDLKWDQHINLMTKHDLDYDDEYTLKVIFCSLIGFKKAQKIFRNPKMLRNTSRDFWQLHSTLEHLISFFSYILPPTSQEFPCEERLHGIVDRNIAMQKKFIMSYGYLFAEEDNDSGILLNGFFHNSLLNALTTTVIKIHTCYPDYVKWFDDTIGDLTTRYIVVNSENCKLAREIQDSWDSWRLRLIKKNTL